MIQGDEHVVKVQQEIVRGVKESVVNVVRKIESARNVTSQKIGLWLRRARCVGKRFSLWLQRRYLRLSNTYGWIKNTTEGSGRASPLQRCPLREGCLRGCVSPVKRVP
jgi:hypothetical protein